MSERDRSPGTDDPVDPGLSRLYRAGAQEAPPPQLDASILAAARREVGARPGRGTTFAANRWRLPVALAAVLVLSVSLVSVVMHERSEELSAPPASEPAVPATGKASTSPPAAVRREEVPAEPLARKRESASAEALPAQPYAAPMPERAAASAGEQADRAQSSATPVEGTTGRVPAAAPPSGRSPSLQSARERAAEPLTAPAGVAPAPHAPAAEADQVTAKESRAATLGQSRHEAASVEAKARSSGRALSPPVARQVHLLEAEPPQKWLERIVLLRREGRIAEADELLAEFERRFPGYPMPPVGGQ